MSAVIVGMGQRNRAVYEAGFSGTVTVPNDVTVLSAWVQGAGGDGRVISVGGTDWQNGGGGGGFSYFETPVLETEWGTSITLSVGAAVNDADGNPSTLSGTLNGVAVSITCNGGARLAGTGGTASGGTININGYDGVAAVPADMTDGSAGLPGGDGQDWIEVGGMGGLGLTQAENGYIAIEWG